MLVFIDANCGLCQRFALWADQRLKHTRALEQNVSWACWGGLTHQNLAATRPKHWPPLPGSPSGPDLDNRLEIFADNQWFEGAAAVLLLLSRLHPPWSWLGKILSLLPKALLIPTYDRIARTRRMLSRACQPAPAAFRQSIQP